MRGRQSAASVVHPPAAALVVRDRDGQPHVRHSHDPVAAGALGGAFGGLLFGLLCFVPFLGSAPAGRTGSC